MTDTKHYKSSYSKLILATTIIGMVLMHGAFMFCMGGMTRNAIGSSKFYIFAFFFALSVIFVLYAFGIQIKEVCLSADHLVIRKKFGKIIIPRNKIQKAERKTDIAGDIRLCGISYFFGHYGISYNKQLGRYHTHVKDTNEMLVIHATDRTYVISCDNSEELIRLLNRQ